MKPVSVGIIGCGNIGGFHAKVLGEAAGADLVAVCDQNNALAGQIAGQYGCAAYTDYRKLLGDSRVELVAVCLPPALHYEVAAAAAKAGQHLLIEKPLDISVENADRLIALCRQCGVRLGVVSQHRYDPVIKALRGLIAGGRLGMLLMGSAKTMWYRSPEYYRSGGGWRGSRANQGGVLMSQAIHYIDLLQYLMGGVSEVSAVCETLLHRQIEVEDTGLALLRFPGGGIGTIEATTIAYPGLRSELNLFAERATIQVRDDKLHEYQAVDGPIPELDALLGEGATGAAVSTPMALDTAPHLEQYRDMCAAIREDREPAVGGADGRAPLAIIEAIHRSAAEKRWIAL